MTDLSDKTVWLRGSPHSLRQRLYDVRTPHSRIEGPFQDEGETVYRVTVPAAEQPELLHQARRAGYAYALEDGPWQEAVATRDRQMEILDPIYAFAADLRDFMADELQGQPLRNIMRTLRLKFHTIADHDHIDGVLYLFAEMTLSDADRTERGRRTDMLDKLLTDTSDMGRESPSSLAKGIALLESIVNPLAPDVRKAVEEGTAMYWWYGVGDLGGEHLDHLQESAARAQQSIAWLRDHGYLTLSREHDFVFAKEHDLALLHQGSQEIREGARKPKRHSLDELLEQKLKRDEVPIVEFREGEMPDDVAQRVAAADARRGMTQRG